MDNPESAALAQLERQLAALEREVADLRTQADGELRIAREWEARAMITVRDGRDDLARDAVRRQQEHANAAEAFAAEAAATGEAVDAYRNAIAAFRAAYQPAAQ